MNVGDPLIACPFCKGTIKLTPCGGLYACDTCGAKVIAPIKLPK